MRPTSFQYDPFAEHRPPKIADREDEYKKHRRTMIISPERLDPFADGGKTPDPKMNARTYMDVMREQHLTKEEVCEPDFYFGGCERM